MPFSIDLPIWMGSSEYKYASFGSTSTHTVTEHFECYFRCIRTLRATGVRPSLGKPVARSSYMSFLLFPGIIARTLSSILHSSWSILEGRALALFAVASISGTTKKRTNEYWKSSYTIWRRTLISQRFELNEKICNDRGILYSRLIEEPLIRSFTMEQNLLSTWNPQQILLLPLLHCFQSLPVVLVWEFSSFLV